MPQTTNINPSQLVVTEKPLWIRRFTKFLCFSTLFLIFAGGLVTSTGSGLSVPDWPLSYGMVFPPMVGGVFYEHGHRMVASCIGLMTLILAITLAIREKERWIKVLGFCALGLVITQGVLGGLTVLLFLPTPVSVAHAVTAQTFLVLTIILAYSQSKERSNRMLRPQHYSMILLRYLLVFVVLIYGQLIIGALMRHSNAGLAIPDFPKMGGQWWPSFDQGMLDRINSWRFDSGMDPVNMKQIFVHFLHRLGALILTAALFGLNIVLLWSRPTQRMLLILVCLDFLFFLQVTLGIATVVSMKEYKVTSLHVVTGASLLAGTVLLLLQSAPVHWKTFIKVLKKGA